MSPENKKKAMVIGALTAIIIILLLLFRRGDKQIDAGTDINIPNIPGVDFPITIFDIPGLSLYEPRGSCGCGCGPQETAKKPTPYVGGDFAGATMPVRPITKDLPKQQTIFNPGFGRGNSQMKVGWG